MKVLLFGKLRDEIGPELDAAVSPDGCSVAELRRLLVGQSAAHAPLALPSARPCVDHTIVSEDCLIRPHQEVAFLPPVSGG